jgi:hypothetical protein
MSLSLLRQAWNVQEKEVDVFVVVELLRRSTAHGAAVVPISRDRHQLLDL